MELGTCSSTYSQGVLIYEVQVVASRSRKSVEVVLEE